MQVKKKEILKRQFSYFSSLIFHLLHMTLCGYKSYSLHSKPLAEIINRLNVSSQVQAVQMLISSIVIYAFHC